MGDWAIGMVEERFWEPHWWNSRFVLLTDDIFWEGETYFIDGHPDRGILTRALPIVATGPCSRTRPVQDAAVDLRVLREPSFSKGKHIIGYVQQPSPLIRSLHPPSAPLPYADVKISVTGPSGARTVTTDLNGIYQLDDIQAGDHKLQLHLPDTQSTNYYPAENATLVQLDHRDLAEQNFRVYWNGRISGHVRNASGEPALTMVMLRNEDNSELSGAIDSLVTDAEGSYQFVTVPPGRYIVMVNPNGPENQWPYDIQYYRPALQTKDAQVLQLAEGQQIKGIDFTVRRLKERTVQVRVTRQNGNPASGTQVCVAYEHTREYGELENTNCHSETDQNGVATIHLYGNSRIRLFAVHYVYFEKKEWWEGNKLYSHPVEDEVGKVPDIVNLVLTSQKP